MKNLPFTIRFIIFSIIISVCVIQIFSQTPTETPKPLDTYQQDQEKLCRDQNISGQRGYKFRALPRAGVDDGAYGTKKWYKTLFPFLKTPQEKYGVDDIRTLRDTFGRPAPVGESKRSKQIRLNAEQKVPDAEKLANLPKFDWRENGLDVGAVGSQGFNCNTCWAFSTVDAMQISRQLAAIRENKDFNKTPRPSARQLISCMVKNSEDFCNINWHGEAFSFMVDKGLPLGGSTKYKARDFKTWECDADTYVKALTWDFVSKTPQKAASKEEIKRALILYGAVVSMIKFDSCFWLYGGGVFNEEQTGNGSHLLLIIGWDDEKQAWLIKNSYGTDWGEGGFGWIKYGSNNIGQWAAVVVPDPKEEERIAKESEKKEQ